MKKLAIVTGITLALSACSSTPNYSKQFSSDNGLQSAQMASAIREAPPWMSKLPKATGYVFENGTATSGDFAFADIKA